jgi:hypothetical protein
LCIALVSRCHDTERLIDDVRLTLQWELQK